MTKKKKLEKINEMKLYTNSEIDLLHNIDIILKENENHIRLFITNSKIIEDYNHSILFNLKRIILYNYKLEEVFPIFIELCKLCNERHIIINKRQEFEDYLQLLIY